MNELIELAYRHAQSEQYIASIKICRQILKKQNCPEIKHLLYRNLQSVGQFEESISIAHELAVDAKTTSNLALAYSAAGKLEESLYYAKKSVEEDPSNSIIQTNYVNILKQLDKQKAFSYLENLVNILSDENVWYHYGLLYGEENLHEKAKDCYLKAISIKSIPIIHYNLSLAYFSLADYKNGWKEYESRWQACWLFENMRKRLRGKFWQGENLEGKSILIWCEQGIGDLIHFYRYIKDLENLGAKVYLKYSDALFGYQYNNQDCDYNCSILTIAGLLNADINTIDGEAYLSSKVKEKIISSNERKIGLCWRGNVGHPKDEERSIKLKEFNFLNNPYSLVREYHVAHYENGNIVNWEEGGNAIDLSKYMISLDYTAKIIEELDIVITVDTVIAHLAGALGKKTYLLLPFNYDWRWSEKFSDKTPWYNSVTIIRQKEKDNWNYVIEKLKTYIIN
jgi:tetratricopeptide (TPR) repeat protein